jgi:methyltransferase (TIGR00027 family)
VTVGIGKTALGMAMIRAAESGRSDRLFEDPYAAAFLDAAPGVFDERRLPAAAAAGTASRGAVFASHAVIRTRFYDDYLLEATGGRPRQVVLVAAGLDTRAYRLAWPDGTRLFELDLPGVLRFKDRVLAGRRAVARCERVAVPADLRGDWSTALTGAGFRPGDPTAWLLEGLLIYLSADEAARLLTAVGDLSAGGSRLAFEYDDHDTDGMRRQAGDTPAMSEYTAMWKGGLPDVRGWLAEHGWRLTVHDRRVVAARFGRGVGEPSTGGFLVAAVS